MYRITNECIEKEITELLEKGSFCHSNIQWFNELCEAMQNFSKMHWNFTEEDAKAWVSAMNPPAKWTMEQTTEVMNKQGFYHKPCEFWAVMNALYSDYGKTMAKFGADKPEVWAALAHDWLDDMDVEPGKAGRYFRDIVKH